MRILWVEYSSVYKKRTPRLLRNGVLHSLFTTLPIVGINISATKIIDPRQVSNNGNRKTCSPATGRLRRAAPTSSGAALPVRAAHRNRAARVPSAGPPQIDQSPPTTPAEPPRPAMRGGDCPLPALPRTNNLRNAPVRLVPGKCVLHKTLLINQL